jgi:hypothetical protein
LARAHDHAVARVEECLRTHGPVVEILDPVGRGPKEALLAVVDGIVGLHAMGDQIIGQPIEHLLTSPRSKAPKAERTISTFSSDIARPVSRGGPHLRSTRGSSPTVAGEPQRPPQAVEMTNYRCGGAKKMKPWAPAGRER